MKRHSVVGDKTSPQKYYAVASSTGSSDIDYLCKLITERSTVSGADAKAVFGQP